MRNWKPIAILLVWMTVGIGFGAGMFGTFVSSIPASSDPVFTATGGFDIGREDRVPTQTPMPTPTVPDYAETEFAVRLTEVAVQATAAHDQRAHELEMEKYHWLAVTGTVAVTSIAQTATAVAVQATETQQAEAIFSARETATAHAPTQIVAVASSNASAEFARLDAVVRIVMIGCMGWALWMVGLFLWRGGSRGQDTSGLAARVLLLEERVSDSAIQRFSDSASQRFSDTVNVKLIEGTGAFVTAWMLSVPCSAEMLTEFAEGIISGSKSAGFEHWEGEGSLWTRKAYSVFRGWLVTNKFAQVHETGMLILNERGLGFLRGWLDERELPERFEFDGSYTQGLAVIVPGDDGQVYKNGQGQALSQR